MSDPATPPDPLDRKALVKARRLLESRYSGVVILVTEGEGKNTKDDFELAGNHHTVAHLVEAFHTNDCSFEESEDDEEEDDDEERWKREGGKGGGPEPA